MLNKFNWLLIPVMALISVVPRLFYLNVPFERDEGAYAYVSDVISRGGLPYLDAFDHKPPGVYYLYNLSFKLFGHEVTSPRIMALLFVMATCVLAFFLVYRMTSSHFAGFYSMVFLGLASSSPAYTGFNSNTEIFTIPLVLGGIWLLLSDEPTPSAYFVSGLAFGAAVLIKQPVATIAAAVLACSIARQFRETRRIAISFSLFSLGSILPILICVTYFAARGGLSAFWEGFYSYNAGYMTGPSIQASYQMLARSITHIFRIDPVTWLAGFAGIIIFVLATSRSYHRWFYLAALSGASASVAMGKYFYLHYFIFMVPFLAIGAALGVGQLLKWRCKGVVIVCSLAILAVSVVSNARYFRMPAREILEISYNARMPFCQSLSLGNWLRAQAGMNGTVFIIGSEPQILFYAGITFPSRFFYFYPVMTPTQSIMFFRNELFNDLQRAMPDYLVFVNNPSSHLIRSPKGSIFIMNMFRLFSRYELVAVSSYWADQVLTDNRSLQNMGLIKNPNSMLVFRRSVASGEENRLSFGSLFGVF